MDGLLEWSKRLRKLRHMDLLLQRATIEFSLFALAAEECAEAFNEFANSHFSALSSKDQYLISSALLTPTSSTADRIRIIANEHYERDFN